jgi:hypothetical protein
MIRHGWLFQYSALSVAFFAHVCDEGLIADVGKEGKAKEGEKTYIIIMKTFILITEKKLIKIFFIK